MMLKSDKKSIKLHRNYVIEKKKKIEGNGRLNALRIKQEIISCYWSLSILPYEGHKKRPVVWNKLKEIVLLVYHETEN